MNHMLLLDRMYSFIRREGQWFYYFCCIESAVSSHCCALPLCVSLSLVLAWQFALVQLTHRGAREGLDPSSHVNQNQRPTGWNPLPLRTELSWPSKAPSLSCLACRYYSFSSFPISGHSAAFLFKGLLCTVHSPFVRSLACLGFLSEQTRGLSAASAGVKIAIHNDAFQLANVLELWRVFHAS